MEMGNILILGSEGFIGSNLNQHLRTYHASVEVNNWNRISDGSIHNVEHVHAALSKYKPTIILNCAWLRTNKTEYKTDYENYSWATSTIQFHKICGSRGIKVYSLGSLSELSSNLNNHYLSAKRATVKALEDAKLLESHCWFRLSYVFSFADKRPNIVKSLMGVPGNISFQLNEPDTINDFIHIHDVVNGILHGAVRNLHGIVDVKSGIQLRNQDFADKILEKRDKIDSEFKCNGSLLSHSSWNVDYSKLALM